MLITLITLLLSLLGLGILICIHELGHLFAAKSVGMKIECFGIGFGKALCTFKVRSVPVQVGWIPFGGYVRIAGMEEPVQKKEKGHKDVHKKTHSAEDPNGFFAKSPLARVWVACAGPLANAIFCLFAFTLVWLGGGRSKPYSFGTDRIGMIDPSSDLYAQNVRPGDKILSYGQFKVESSRDHLRAAMTAKDALDIQVESLTGQKRIIHTAPKVFSEATMKDMKTFGVLAPASFLVWTPPRNGLSSVTNETAFKTGDRIVWVNGERIYSLGQMRDVLHKDEVYCTVMRKGVVHHLSVPRCRVSDLKLSPEVRGELMDWMYEAELPKAKLAALSFIPYNLTQDCVVEAPISYLNTSDDRSNFGHGLLPGDTIMAVWGVSVTRSSELLRQLQQPKAAVIVERGVSYRKIGSFQELDTLFSRPYLSPALGQLIQTIGLEKSTVQSDVAEVHLQLLTNVPLVTRQEMIHPHVASSLQEDSKELYLGLMGVQDVFFKFNPSPVEAMRSLFEEITSTFGALFSGAVSPKWMCGPVGIVQLVQQQWEYGGFDVLFWLGAISFNLALINLLPLPVLDGGYILMAFFEIITFRKISPKISGKIITPFAFLLFSLLIYLTYNDIVRIIHQIYK